MPDLQYGPRSGKFHVRQMSCIQAADDEHAFVLIDLNKELISVFPCVLKCQQAKSIHDLPLTLTVNTVLYLDLSMARCRGNGKDLDRDLPERFFIAVHENAREQIPMSNQEMYNRQNLARIYYKLI